MKKDLSPTRQRLVEKMQRLNFGHIENLHVRNGEPLFDPPPRVIRSVKLGGDNGPRHEATKDDFPIQDEVIELFNILDQIGDGVVERGAAEKSFRFFRIPEHERGPSGHSKCKGITRKDFDMDTEQAEGGTAKRARGGSRK